MRKYLFYILFILLPFTGKSQLPDGSFAPDFTLQDIHGNTWHLYDLLDEGKNVIIDISATWCVPCWAFHQSHVLNDIYSLYGPSGTDEFMVLMVEGDPNTNLDCLYDLPGCNGVTTGDWTEGTLYPIINDDFFATNYYLTYWPTLYYICPNKIIHELSNPTTAGIYAMKNSCVVANGTNNASVISYDSFSGTFCGSVTLEPTIKVQNLGHVPIVSAKAACYINDVLQQTVTWAGNVVPFATFPISFDELTIASDASLMIRITNVNDVSDDDASNNEIVSHFTRLATQEQNLLQLEFTTGNSPREVYWKIANSDSTVLYKGGNPMVIGKPDDGGSYTSPVTTYIIPIPLPGDGCYSFSIYDGIGYGIGLKNYKITEPDGTVIFSGGNFPDSEHHLIGIENALYPVVNNGAISKIDGLPEIFCSHTQYPLSLRLQNLGTNSISQAQIELLDDGNILNLVEWTGDLLPGNTATISIPPGNFSSGDILFRIKSINGEQDAFAYQNETHEILKRNLSNDHVISFELQLDFFGYEIYWQLTNSNGEVIYSGGNTKVGPGGGGSVATQPDDPGAYDPFRLVQEDLVLPTTDDCYDFLLVDGHGDGIILGGSVRFSEKHSGKEVFYANYTGIEFETEKVLLDVSSLETSTGSLVDVGEILLYPNPAQTDLQIQFELKRSIPITISVTNMLGERVLTLPEKTYSAGSGHITMDLSSLFTGIYYLQMKSGNQQITRKVAVMQ